MKAIRRNLLYRAFGLLGMGLLFGLFGCSKATIVDFKKTFDYRINGFSGDGVLLSDVLPRATKKDFAELVDYNDENNQEFLNTIFYKASKEKNLKNGDEITINVNCNEELGKKAGLKPENISFIIKVEGLTELADDSSMLKNEYQSLQTENEEALRKALEEDAKFPASKTDQFTTLCSADPSSLEYQGSALVYLNDSEGISRWNSNYLSLYTAKYNSESEELDNQYCYILSWMPQSSTDGSFASEDITQGRTIEIERASNLDKELFGIRTDKLNTSSAGYARENGAKLNQELAESVIDKLYPEKRSGISMFSIEDGSLVSWEDLNTAFSKIENDQRSIAEDIHFESGMNLVTLQDLTLQDLDSLGPGGLGKTLPAKSQVTIYEVYAQPVTSLFYGEIYARINENQWICIEDKKYYYALPESEYSRLIEKDSRLLKAHEGISPYAYPSSLKNIGSEAETSDESVKKDNSQSQPISDSPTESGTLSSFKEPSISNGSSSNTSSDNPDSAGLSGPSETYVLSLGDRYVYSYSEPNMYGMSIQVNKYISGSEVQVYATKEVDYQGTYGQIGKNEWILLSSGDDGLLWTKK